MTFRLLYTKHIVQRINDIRYIHRKYLFYIQNVVNKLDMYIVIKSLAEKGDKRAALVLRLSDQYDKLLSTILIGNNIVNIASASVATVLFIRWAGEETGPSLSTIVTTVVVLIFGEISPKTLAKESPELFARFSAPIIQVLIYILTPVNFLFVQWKKLDRKSVV